MDKFDLILKGGHLIDPAQNFNSGSDIGIHNGRIKKLDKNINPAHAKKS